jgi:DNA adenine methylase
MERRLHNCVEVETIARRLQNVYIDHLDFRRCIKNWDRPDTFFYCDPPHFGATAYRTRLHAFTMLKTIGVNDYVGDYAARNFGYYHGKLRILDIDSPTTAKP